jgi:hypothetical protein
VATDLGKGGGFGTYYAGGPHSISLKIPDIPLFVPGRARGTLNHLITRTVHQALAEVAGRVSDEAGKFSDSGQLAQSFGSDPASATGGIELMTASDRSAGADIHGRVFSTLPHAIVMELGRRAGQPISRSGIDAIGLWAQRKLGLSAAEAAGAKWAIAKAIIAHGIEGKYYFADGVAAARPRVEMMFRILGDQLTAALLKAGQGQTGTA